MVHRGYVLRRLVLTTCTNGTRAPWRDSCWGRGTSGPRLDDRWHLPQPSWLAPPCEFRYKGWAFMLCPWRRNQYGERQGGKAVVVGWVTSRWPLGTEEPVPWQQLRATLQELGETAPATAGTFQLPDTRGRTSDGHQV